MKRLRRKVEMMKMEGTVRRKKVVKMRKEEGRRWRMRQLYKLLGVKEKEGVEESLVWTQEGSRD